MIGRLIQQQEVGLRHERPPEHGAPPPAPGQGAERRVGVEPEPRDDLIRLQRGLPIPLEVHRGGLAHDQLPHGVAARRRHFLGKTRHLRAGTNPQLAAIGRDLASDELQERGLSLAVAAEHAHALALGDQKADAVQQRLGAETQRDFIQTGDLHEAAYGKRLRGLTHAQNSKSRGTGIEIGCRIGIEIGRGYSYAGPFRRRIG